MNKEVEQVSVSAEVAESVVSACVYCKVLHERQPSTEGRELVRNLDIHLRTLGRRFGLNIQEYEAAMRDALKEARP